jgi:predicted dehydrogenase
MQKMKRVGLGIIGLGYVGTIHLQHSTKLANSRLVAVADQSKRALHRVELSGVKTYTDYKQLLKDSDVDAVIIALPTHLHLQCARLAAEAKKHIFLEKPMARNVEEAKQIISYAQNNSVKLMIGYPHRFNETFCKLKRTIDSGALGDIEVANATFISSGPFYHRAEGYAPVPVPEWWFKAELTGGGALVDLGSHIINLLRWYFGEIRDIKGHFGHRYNMDLEDSAICLANFDKGTTGIINVGWFSQGFQLKLEVFGTVACTTAEHVPSNIFSAATQMLTTRTSRFHRPHLVELQYFVNCLNRDLPPSPSGQEGLEDLEAIARAYKNEIIKD